jgi:aminopeptidase N
LTLGTLERFVGEDVMSRIMRTYAERWKFDHPSSQDFFQIVNEVSAQNFSWFFDQFFRGTKTLDYELASAESTVSSGRC